MRHLYGPKRCAEDRETIDALVALRMLEDNEHREEQEFFRIIGDMQQFGCSAHELEDVLPDLLKTRREHALYAALMTVAKDAGPHVRHHAATH